MQLLTLTSGHLSNLFVLFVGNECSSNEGSNSLSVVLMPWEGDDVLPDKFTVFSKIFQFHHEIWEDQLNVYNKHFNEEIYFHLDRHPPEDRKKPCLNNVFGRAGTYFWEQHKYDYEKELSFFTWLQKIMVPSRRYIAGEQKMNPVAEFFITTLAPGWVGGILTGETWT